ncbi:hypothetical protein QUF80_06750 [Desulfococcaceae bacterium HSG8]|nr:hypothetical protein [Desulfococcaceae bacterium HSG8]
MKFSFVVKMHLFFLSVMALASLFFVTEGFAATIEGAKFNDLNNNGVMDAGEPVFANHNIFIRDDSGSFFPLVTDVNGRYSSAGHDAATFTVWSGIPDGWLQTTPGEGEGMITYTITLAQNETITINFGITLPIYVDGSFSGVGTGEPASPYKTITEAINNSGPNGIIRVGMGIYEGLLTIVKGLTLEGGWKRDKTAGTWHRDNPLDPRLTIITGGISIGNAPDTLIEGFVLQNGLIIKNSDGLEIANNIIMGTHPVHVENSNDVRIDRNEIFGTEKSSSFSVIKRTDKVRHKKDARDETKIEGRYGVSIVSSVARVSSNIINVEKRSSDPCCGILYDDSNGEVASNVIHTVNTVACGVDLRLDTGSNFSIDSNNVLLEGESLIGIWERGGNPPAVFRGNNIHGEGETLVFYRDENDQGGIIDTTDCADLRDKLLPDIPVQESNGCIDFMSEKGIPYSPCTGDFMPCAEYVGQPLRKPFLQRPVSRSTDTDGDGMPDRFEQVYFGDLSRNGSGDYDKDGLTDFDEFTAKTNPADEDTDDDGMPDGCEVDYELNPHLDDASEDPDGDGKSNIEECSSDPPTCPTCPVCPGDINGDGEITPQDAQCAFEKWANICPTSCGIPCDEVCADVNGDEKCTVRDTLCIFHKYFEKPCP